MWENVTDGDGKFLDMPVMILVNEGSASASEIPGLFKSLSTV